MGLEVQPGTGIVIDQETKNQINFEGKTLKANNDPEKSIYISEHDIPLEPANPKYTKLLERLFGYYTDGEAEIGNLPEIKAYYFDRSDDKEKYRLVIKFETGVRWTGNWYYNKIISYVEAIFCLNGAFIDKDLTPFDVPQEE